MMELSVSHARALRILTKNLFIRPDRCGNGNVYCEEGKSENPTICSPLVTPDPPFTRPPRWEANKCSIPSPNRQYVFFFFLLLARFLHGGGEIENDRQFKGQRSRFILKNVVKRLC